MKFSDNHKVYNRIRAKYSSNFNFLFIMRFTSELLDSDRELTPDTAMQEVTSFVEGILDPVKDEVEPSEPNYQW